MNRPRVTIGLPVFNGSAFIKEALEALLAQTFEDFELLVSDNASTDDTPAIVQEFAARDARVRYHRCDRNVGASANFNRLVPLARGTYFKWAAADDRCAPTFIERCVEALEADPTCVLAYPGTRLIHVDGSPLPYDAELEAFIDHFGKAWNVRLTAQPGLEDPDPVVRFRSLLLESSLCQEVFGLIRTDALRTTGLIPDYYGSDKVLLSELALRGRFHYVSEPLFFRRCHPRQSGHRDVRAREHWISGRRPGLIVFPQGRVFGGYIGALRDAQLGVTASARGYAALWRYVARPEKLKLFIFPGPDNFLGINPARRAARAGATS